jgi:hypothetical protein
VIEYGREVTGLRAKEDRMSTRKSMYDTLTWDNGYEVHLGVSGDRRAVVPMEIADNQREYDGKTFLALLPDGSWMRVRLCGEDYDLCGSGTGDMVVRPVRVVVRVA